MGTCAAAALCDSAAFPLLKEPCRVRVWGQQRAADTDTPWWGLKVGGRCMGAWALRRTLWGAQLVVMKVMTVVLRTAAVGRRGPGSAMKGDLAWIQPCIHAYLVHVRAKPGFSHASMSIRCVCACNPDPVLECCRGWRLGAWFTRLGAGTASCCVVCMRIIGFSGLCFLF